MSNAAKVSLLEQLHNMTAQRMLELINDPDISPQMLSQVVKFLKDNGIEPASDADNEALNKLAAEVDSILTDDQADSSDFIN